MKKNAMLSILGLALFACGPYQKKDLIGKWEAVAVLEEGKPLPVNVQEITFTFYRNNGYNFTSTLRYIESGTFSIKGKLLYTLDTLDSNSRTKAVEIRTASRDSLFFVMQDGGKKRLVKLHRVKSR